MEQQVSESAIRSRAKRSGFRVKKSRQRTLHLNNRGQYQLIDASRNYVVLGSDYDATLEGIDAFLREQSQ